MLNEAHFYLCLFRNLPLWAYGELKYLSMKKTFILFCILIITRGVFAQSSVNASGGDFSNSSTSVSYSVGQVGYVEYENGISVNEGVQQPYEIYDITNIIGESVNDAGRRNSDDILGIEEAKLEISLSAYPNPTDDYLTLLVEGTDAEMEYSVYDISGRMLSAQKVFSGETSIDMSNLPPATYFVKVTGEEIVLKTFKIVKN